MATVSLIIPCWNGRPWLEGCLQALRRAVDRACDLIVVDNASTDGSVEVVRTLWPSARLIQHTRNLGFAGAVNAGLRQAEGEWLVLLNQDVEVAPDWLAALTRAFAEPGVGIVGCKLLYPDGRTLQHAGGDLEWPQGWTRHLGQGQPDDGRFDQVAEVPFVTGAAMAISRRVLETVGLFDTGFFPAYYEDVDLCHRARLAGFRVLYWPAARAVHHESRSLPTETAISYYHRGRLRFLLKHCPPERLCREFFAEERVWLQKDRRPAVHRALYTAYVAAQWLALAPAADGGVGEATGGFRALPDLTAQRAVAAIFARLQAEVLRLTPFHDHDLAAFGEEPPVRGWWRTLWWQTIRPLLVRYRARLALGPRNRQTWDPAASLTWLIRRQDALEARLTALEARLAERKEPGQI